MVKVARHFLEDFLAKFVHPHHFDTAIARGNFRCNGLDLYPKPWIMEPHADHQAMCHHVQLSLEGIPLHAWNQDTISRVIGVDNERDYILPRSTRKEDARMPGIWAWTTSLNCILRVMQLSLPAQGRRHLRYRVLVHLGLHEDLSRANHDDPRANKGIYEFFWHHGVEDGKRITPIP